MKTLFKSLYQSFPRGNDNSHRQVGLKARVCNWLVAFILTVMAMPATVFAAPADDFFEAIKYDRESALLTLMLRGFDVNTLDDKGRSGLYWAAAEGAFKTAKVLLDWKPTDVNKLNPQGESPLMMAALKGHTELAKNIIKRGGDVNKTGWTPLHYAATSGHLEIIKMLLQEHAYIDAESPNGSTPLMMAAMYGTEPAAKLLLEEGADASIKNQKGLTALDFAQLAERDGMVKIINAASNTPRLKPQPSPSSLTSLTKSPTPEASKELKEVREVREVREAREVAKPVVKTQSETTTNFQFESQMSSK